MQMLVQPKSFGASVTLTMFQIKPGSKYRVALPDEHARGHVCRNDDIVSLIIIVSGTL
ncbi:uncharacterized protein PHALS_03913 [Plasmopara halstedii]|uniref:Uncharacterized protein n=1 Tax=Plasmopara halstedii TaxID=4781 RepID=A0A0P1B006_PLAHL|nr:uncharacterized protein PHALS_03913 [Plasmopara halstedii]CEG47266.1 hypothetical protein PHALS_03913 [Plasmopara halstedii]|eukprot:XP_024583635.1 hypothetical protein PHALS_03913 [Plasmopara halstedii]